MQARRFRFKTHKLNRSTGGNAVLFLLLCAGGVFMGLPILFTVVHAFKPIEELFLFPPRFFVHRPVLDNFSNLFHLTANTLIPFPRYLFNSLFVTVFGTVVYVYISSMAAYPLAHLSFRGKAVIYGVIVFSLLFVGEVMDVPRYIIMARGRILDTHMAIMFPMWAGALGVFLMERFMSSFPKEIIEAAEIDGCYAFALFRKIIMPSMKPAWLTLTIFTFRELWNADGQAVIFTEHLRLLPAVMAQLHTGSIARAGVGAAVALFMLLPPLVLFLLVQSKVMETMAHAGMKA